MKRAGASAAALLLAGQAMAGGVDRSGQPIGALFEPGNYVELSFTSLSPKVSGTQLLGGARLPSGNMADGAGYAGLALKFAVTEQLDAAILYGEPYGAGVDYPVNGYFAQGSTASLTSHEITTVARYKFSDRFSAYAGLRAQSFQAEANIPFVANYNGSTDTAHNFGYLAGVAYERPEIALRVALTYYSKVRHDLTATESSLAGGPADTPLRVETPQAVNLDFRTGIAEDTLLFGGVRWVNWKDFDISPTAYVGLASAPLVSFNADTFTYTLGVGRRLNENWSVALSAVHEPATGGFKSNLNPTDGRSAIGLGVSYTQNNMKLDMGVQHIWLGDATTQVSGAPAGDFTDNTALGFGMKVGFSF